MSKSAKYNPLAILKKRRVPKKVSAVNNENKVKKVQTKKPVSYPRIQCAEENNLSVSKPPRREVAGEIQQNAVVITPIGSVEKEELWKMSDNYFDYQRRKELRDKRLARAALKKAQWQPRWEAKLAVAAAKERAREARLARVAERKAQFWKDWEEIKKDPREYDLRARSPISVSNSDDSTNSVGSGPGTSDSSEDAEQNTEDQADNRPSTRLDKVSENKRKKTWWKNEETGECGVRCCEINNPIHKQQCHGCNDFLGDYLPLEDSYNNQSSTSDSNEESVKNIEEPMDNARGTCLMEAIGVSTDNQPGANSSSSTNDLDDVWEVIEKQWNQPSTSSGEMNTEDAIGIDGIVIEILTEAAALEKTQGGENNQEASEGLTQRLDLDTLFPQ